MDKGCGVYAITHKESGRTYVGSTSVSFKRRWYYHKWQLRKGIHLNPRLQRAWLKYGEDAFEFKILESCDESETLRVEQRWLNELMEYGLAYNIAKLATRPPHYSQLSDEAKARQKAKISAANTGRKHSDAVRHKMSLHRKGLPVSDTHRANLSAAASKRRWSAEQRAKLSAKHSGKVLSARHKQHISENSGKRRKDWPALVRPDGMVVQVHSINALAAEYGLNKSMLGKLAKGIKDEYKGWKRHEEKGAC